MRNTAARTYASSISTNLTEYEDLPGHHLLSIRNLIALSLDESYPETASSISDDVNFFMNNFMAEAAEDYSGVRDPDAFCSFQLATAYYLTCSEDSSEGDYDPARECFMVQLRVMTGMAGQARRRTNRWCRLRPLLLRQARRCGRHSLRSTRSFKPSSTSSVGKLRSFAPHSSSSVPRVARMPRRRDASLGSGS